MDSYLYHISKFIVSGKAPRYYLLYLINQEKSDETVRSAGFAIKFYLNIIKKDSSQIQSVFDTLSSLKRKKDKVMI